MQTEQTMISVGKGSQGMCGLLPSMAMRHGLIAGATGTGKTVTLKVLAEGFSKLGVPVFLVDFKGDVSSMAKAGSMNEKLAARLTENGIDPDSFDFAGFPVRFWDVFGENGLPVRAKISDLGPDLLARLLALTPAQTGVLNIIFRVADDRGWQLIDLKDLKAMAGYVSDHRKELQNEYGTISSASAGAIVRAVLALENQGAESFFLEPDLNIRDWFTQNGGLGTINLLEASRLGQNPLLYSTFLLWMLSELYEALPEAGALDKPKLVFFFDEAHMIFDGAPKALRDKILQVVRLIRSKGVSVWFITQNPSDLDDEVLSQLQNRIQHALHAYTPADQKKLKAAAAGFRPNPQLDTLAELSALKTGQALVSFLDENGAPLPVEKVTVLPPRSSFDALSTEEIRSLEASDPMMVYYEKAVDNYSAYEALEDESEKELQAKAEEEKRIQAEKEEAAARKQAEKEEAAARKQAEKEAAAAAKAEQKRQEARSKALSSSVKRASKSAARSIGRDVGKSITRGILGSDNSTAKKAAGNFAGNLLGDLIGGLFR